MQRKSKSFFAATAYKRRNHVYTHSDLDNVFSIGKNFIHIHIEDDDNASQVFVNKFLRSVFKDSIIGISSSNKNSDPLFDSLNFVLI